MTSLTKRTRFSKRGLEPSPSLTGTVTDIKYNKRDYTKKTKRNVFNFVKNEISLNPSIKLKKMCFTILDMKPRLFP